MFGKWRFRDRIIIILYKCRDVSCGVAFINPSGPMKVVMFVYIFASNKSFLCNFVSFCRENAFRSLKISFSIKHKMRGND